METGLTLYQISDAIRELDNTDDMTQEEIDKAMAILQEELMKKSSNIIGYIKNMELTVDAMKSEETRIATNRKALENRISRIKEMAKNVMEVNNIKKLETELGTMTVAKNPMSVEIIDETRVPDEFKRIEVVTKVDKAKIKEHYKDTGELIEGVNIIDNATNLKIK